MIRQAKKEDIENVYSLSRRIENNSRNKDDYLSSLEDTNQRMYVLLSHQRIIGYALYLLETNDIEVDEIAIEKEEEGKGNGRFLLAETLSLLKKEGYTTCFLEVRRSNKNAQSLYQRTGFAYYRTRKMYYGDEDALCYEKRLTI